MKEILGNLFHSYRNFTVDEEGVLISDFLPIAQLYYFYRYHVHITEFLVVSKPVVNSRNQKSA
jgi:hypothetical protein